MNPVTKLVDDAKVVAEVNLCVMDVKVAQNNEPKHSYVQFKRWKYKEREHSIKFVDIHQNLMKLRAVYLATLCNVKLLISARICVKKVISSRMKVHLEINKFLLLTCTAES